VKTREVHLVSRPEKWPEKGDFALRVVPLAEPEPGEVVVRNTVMSVDPYMRNRMNVVESYINPFALGACLDGGAIGEVLESRHPGFTVGDVVLHDAGWREHAVLPAGRLRKLDVNGVPASAYLGVLGMPGLTAYVGLTAIANVGEGDVVFVSGAAGAVGSVAGQLAKKLGAATVIGSAGTPQNVAWLRDLGFDEVFNYRDGINRQL
jgi:NADPH-dependent curcumin reductase CurA